MHLLPRYRRLTGLVLVIAMACTALMSAPAMAGTTGTITGTITDGTTGAAVANATVVGTSPSGTQSTKTDARGFYVLQQLIPDDYTVTVTSNGYASASAAAVIVQQDLTTQQSFTLTKTLGTIATVRSRSSSSLVKPDTTSDTYTVSGAQLNAISGGNDLHKTLYQYIAAIPGITGSGFPAQPRVHGGSAADISYEFDGIPINENITGLFTTNLSNVGIGNIEVSTGGLSAANAASGIGIINTIAKTGTYPGFGDLSYTATPQYRNIYETVEYGGATSNRRLSWFFSLDNTNALNQWESGQTFPNLLVQLDNNPGVVKTTDLIGNFHFRPTSKDDFQFLITNSLFEAAWGGTQRAPGEPLPLTADVCSGATVVATAAGGPSYSGAEGGTAPNGATCPQGLYYGTASTQDGGGNLWHHYGGLGKIQWNHIVNDHSTFAITASENFNQYIFDQPIIDPNLPQFENNNDFSVGGCPLAPYLPGAPIMSDPHKPGVTGRSCVQNVHWFNADYEDRASRIYSLSGKYDNELNANDSIEVGAGEAYSDNLYQLFYPGWFNTPGEWANDYPAIVFDSSYPTRDSYAYAQGNFKAGKFLLSPGLRYTSRKYDYPYHGGAEGNAWNPTFSMNYSPGPNDVIIGSASTTASLVASAYVYRYEPPGPLNGPVTGSASFYYCSPFSTGNCNISPAPTRTHSYNLMWEHSFNSETSIKVGPYFNEASNIFENYVPESLQCNAATPPLCGFANVPGAQGTFANNGVRRSFGFELGVNHLDPRPIGVSWWLSTTTDNFWTNTNSSLTTPYGTLSIPPATDGILLRSSQDPPVSGTFTAEVNDGDMHFIPQLYLQSAVTYYTGPAPTQAGVVAYTPNKTSGWGVFNGTIEFDVGRNRDIQIGLQGENIFNNTRPVVPCSTTSQNVYNAYFAGEGLGVGCSSGSTGTYMPIGGPGEGIGSYTGASGSPGFFGYQNLAQSQPLFFFFITKRL